MDLAACLHGNLGDATPHGTGTDNADALENWSHRLNIVYKLVGKVEREGIVL